MPHRRVVGSTSTANDTTPPSGGPPPTIESAAHAELTAAGTLTTHALIQRLRARGLDPQNLTTTLVRSRRILSLTREDAGDRYRWYVKKKKNGHS